MKLVGYVRVSTDDKGQDPERQKQPILSRAAKDGNEVVAWVEDNDGNHKSSGGIPALDRARVKEAISLAKKVGARGIIVESVDRWSRSGPQDIGVSMWLLQHDHELTLTFADLQGDDFVVELLTGILATVAKMTRARLRDMTKTGMANARRKRHDSDSCADCMTARWCPDARMGRPPKEKLTDDEWQQVVVLLEKGRGVAKIALELTRGRLVGRDGSEVVDAKARRRRTVSEAWLRDQIHARSAESPGLLTRVVRPCHAEPRPKGPVPTRQDNEATEAAP